MMSRKAKGQMSSLRIINCLVITDCILVDANLEPCIQNLVFTTNFISYVYAFISTSQDEDRNFVYNLLSLSSVRHDLLTFFGVSRKPSISRFGAVCLELQTPCLLSLATSTEPTVSSSKLRQRSRASLKRNLKPH